MGGIAHQCSHHRNHRRRCWLTTTLTAVSLLLFFASSSALVADSRILQIGEVRKLGGWSRSVMEEERLMSGPGSFPPTCRSKCGRCSPCKPVHVPIQPGLSVPLLEYYPEAWRCKCGKKLYMP